jgi:hypothetical protein
MSRDVLVALWWVVKVWEETGEDRWNSGLLRHYGWLWEENEYAF